MMIRLCFLLMLTGVCYGQDKRHPPKPETPFAFAAVADVDGDGAVSLEEWDRFLAGLAADETGAVDPGVFHDLVHAHVRANSRRAREGGVPAGLPPDFPLDLDRDGSFELEDLNAIFAELDLDGNGLISADELPMRPERRPPRRRPRSRH